MATVLANRSLAQLADHFKTTGNRLASYCENQPALQSWIQQLRADMSRSDFTQDSSLMDIIQKMCEPDKNSRLDARDLVRRLNKLDSPYRGSCCSVKKSSSGLTANAMQSCGISSTVKSSNGDSPSSDDLGSSDIEDDDYKTISELDSDEMADNVLEQTYSLTAGPDVPKHREVPTLGREAQQAHDSIANIQQAIVCPKIRMLEAEGLADHMETPAQRAPLGVQDLTKTGITSSTERNPCSVSKPVTADTASQSDRPSSQSQLLCRWPGCLYTMEATADDLAQDISLRHHLRDVHLVHEVGLSGLSFDKGSTGTTAAATLTAESGALQLYVTKNKKVRFDASAEPGVMSRQDSAHSRKGSPLRQQQSAKNLPLVPDISQKPANDQEIPPFTRVPSYWLAKQNMLSHTTFQFMSTRPLFVYGTLMFPSVLRSKAASFVSSEGTYSSLQGRRLRTISRDWSGMDLSIKTAAEHMTPATAAGFVRYTDQVHPRHAVAMLGSATSTQSTTGLLVHGLSDEALACLDHLYEEKGPRKQFNVASGINQDEWLKTLLKRCPITVRICLADGHSIEIEADTYMAVILDESSTDMAEPWSTKSFIQSRAFNSLTSHVKNNELILEEQAIASAIGTTLVLPGDELAELALVGNVQRVESMLRDGYDVNSISSRHGTALQAAASKGDVRMMKFLMRAGASVNISGGHYQTPLIAAVVEGNYDAMKLLLQHDAEVFIGGGKYISAIYQAVDFENLRMVHALLEKGAWLTRDFEELLDLADERDNDEIYDELVQYDVRDLHKRRRNRSRKQGAVKPNEDEVAFINRTAGAICLWEAFKLHNQPGKWTGIKGVQVLRAGMKHGLSETVLEKIRPHVHSFPAIQDFFADAVEDRLGGRLRPVRHTDPHRRRFKDSSQANSALYTLAKGFSKDS